MRQSGFTGGAINAVTKSGTNDLKVSAYLYSKSDQLQGDKYDGGKLSLSEMRNNTLGFSVGAPIVRNKLFVFANFEREWNTTPGNSRLARTSESQDFGKALQYNRPTTAKLDEMSRFLIDNYGYNPGAYQNYSVKTPGYKLMARVDWNINRNHALNVRFSRTQNKYSSAPSSPFRRSTPAKCTTRTFTAAPRSTPCISGIRATIRSRTSRRWPPNSTPASWTAA